MKLFCLIWICCIAGSLRAAETCNDDLSIIGKNAFATKTDLEISREVLQQEASRVLGRRLSDKELDSLEKARTLGGTETYSPSDVIEQNKLLTKAGMSEEDIKKLRLRGVLGNWVIDTFENTPTQVRILDQNFVTLGKETLQQVKAGKTYSYVIDEMGQIHFFEGTLDFSPDTLLYIKVKPLNGPERMVLVREGGVLNFGSQTKKLEFSPKYGFYPRDAARAEVNAFLKEKGIQSTAEFKPNPKLDQLKTFKCLDILEARQKGKGFVLNSIIGDNAVMTGAIFTGELMGAGRLQHKDQREVVITDYEASNATWIINGFLRRGMVLKQINFGSYAATRIPINFVLIELQREFFRANLSKNADERSGNIRNYNLGWMMAKLPMGYYYDRYLVNTLPTQLFAACQNGSKFTQVLFAPGMMALYEKTFTAVLYYAVRKHIVSE